MTIPTTASTNAHPPIVSRAEWLAARLELLQREKEQTRARDALNATRRRLPMVPVPADYRFSGVDGEVRFVDLFEGQRQLIVYHFMFAPDWDTGCPGCTNLISMYADVKRLHDQNTNFVMVSRAPYAKLAAYRDEHGWTIPWYSSGASTFNYDFHATVDPSVAPVQHNYRLADPSENIEPGELSGMSVFLRLDNDSIFHTYSTFARGVERVTDPWSLLDLTPYGRQEGWEDSPDGWPQSDDNHV